MSATDKRFLVVLRLLMAWTFLYAASHQVLNPNFSVVGFLSHTKTFNGLFQIFTGPTIAPVMNFLVAYGHLAIGLSLLFGLLVRVSSLFGAAILMLYWMAHMDFPYISDHNNFIVDFHIVYAVVLVYLSVKAAGQYYGLDGVFSNTPVAQHHPGLRKVLA